MIEGKQRVEITEFLNKKKFFEAYYRDLPENENTVEELEALRRTVTQDFDRYSKLNKNISEESLAAIKKAEDPIKLSDTIAGHLTLTVEKKQELLETTDVAKRLEKILEFIQSELSVFESREKDKDPSKKSDGKDTKGVLSERANEGDPKRARRQLRGSRRNC